MAKRSAGPLCLRLSPDLHIAVTQMAEAIGVTTSEYVRDMLFRMVYGEPQGVDEGFMQGRAIGLQVAREAMKVALNQLPENHTDAIALLRNVQHEARVYRGEAPDDEDE